MLKKITIIGAIIGLSACSLDVHVASRDISQAADNFEVARRVVFYDATQGKHIFLVEGFCSIEHVEAKRQLKVTCKDGPNSYKTHYLGMGDNLTYFAEQLEPIKASAYHYRVIIKPQEILPALDVRVN